MVAALQKTALLMFLLSMPLSSSVINALIELLIVLIITFLSSIAHRKDEEEPLGNVYLMTDSVYRQVVDV